MLAESKKAKEAVAKYRIDMGTAIYKALSLALIALPTTLILKAAVEGKGSETTSVFTAIFNLPFDAYLTLLGLLAVGTYAASKLVESGIEILNNIES